MKKPNETSTQKLDLGNVLSYEVNHVRNTKAGVYFTLILNGVTINSCRVVESKDKTFDDFISLPSYKSSNGEYYNTVYFKFSKEDTKKILAEVEKALNE